MKARTVGRCLVFLAVLNFAAFWYSSFLLGGDALGGKAENGRYFLRDKQQYTEVSASVFRYSRLHAMSLFLTHPLGALGALGLHILKDPFLVARNKRRDNVTAGIVVAVLLLTFVSGYMLLPFWLLPIIIVGAMILELRDAVTMERRPSGPTGSGVAAEQADAADEARRSCR